MKKIILIWLFFSLLTNIVFAGTFAKSDNRGKDQTEILDSQKMVNLLNGNRDAGDINFGLEYEFDSTTYYFSATALEAGRFVVAYQDPENSLFGTAIVGTITGSTISYGSEFVYNTAASYYNSVTALASDKIVIAYSDAGNSDFGTAIVGSITGDEITFGAEFIFDAAYPIDISTVTLDSDRFVIAYSDDGNLDHGTTIVGTVTGSNISFGSEFVFHPAFTFLNSAATLDTNQIVVAYQDFSNSNFGAAVIGTVSGNDIAFGMEYVFNAASTNDLSITALNTSEFVVVYCDEGNSDFGSAIVGSVSGSTISYGSEFVFNADNTYYCSASTLDANNFIVAYLDNTGKSIVGTVFGSDMSFGSEFEFNPASIYYCSTTTLDTDHFVITYCDFGSSYSGTGIVGEIEDDPLPVELSSFTAVYSNGNSILDWTTQSETNNSGWNIFRCETGNYDESIRVNHQHISGAGTCSEPTNYSFTDESSLIENTTYHYWLESTSFSGITADYGPISLTIPLVDEDENHNPENEGFHISNFPNPFSANTTFLFHTAEDGMEIEIRIYNIKGEKIKTFSNLQISQSSNQQIYWGGTDENHKPVKSGIYLYRLDIDGKNSAVRKCIILK